MSEHLTDRDAISLMLEYYGQRYEAGDTARLIALLGKAGVLGLVQYAFEQGVLNERGERNR